MQQQCHISMIFLAWLVYLGGLAAAVRYSAWTFGAVWLIACPLFQWLYLRRFPSLSAALGYGRIADEAAAASLPPAGTTVKQYTALGCPFCPLMEKRLDNLQKVMGFTVEKIDVTLRPSLLASEGIRSVPAVEIDGRFLTGMVTTHDLAEAILGAQAARSLDAVTRR